MPLLPLEHLRRDRPSSPGKGWLLVGALILTVLMFPLLFRYLK
jgi:hypothetical protein